MKQHERKVPFVAQSQKTECGLTCICMINRYYRNNLSMEELREQLEIGRDGSSFQQLKHVLEKQGFEVKCYNIPAEKIYILNRPSILFWNNNHFIILEKVKNNRAVVVDPAIGRYVMNMEELAAGYTGYAITPVPGEGFNRNKSKTRSWAYFLSYIFEHKLMYAKILFLSFIVYALTLCVPMLIQRIIDNIVEGNNIQNGNMLFITLGVLSVSYLIFVFLKNISLSKLRISMDRSLNKNIFHHLLMLAYKFFSLRSSGDIIYSLNGSLRIKDLFADQFIMSVLDCGAGIVILIYIFSLSVELGIAAGILFLINVIVISITKPVLLENNRSIIASQSKVQSIQMETVYSMLGIKMCAIEDDVFSTWESSYSKYYDKNRENEKVKNRIEAISAFLQFVSPATLLFLGIFLVNRGSISMGTIIAIYSLGGTFFGLSSSVLNMWTSFINSSIIFDRLVDIMKAEEEYDCEMPEEAKVDGSIVLKDVSFKFTKDSKMILKHIDLEIEKGAKVAIVGKSGSGKSTLAKLLVGLFEPSEGEIFFNNIELKKWKKKTLRRQIGIVPQDITLFSNSIFDNVIVNRTQYKPEDVCRACKIAQIHDEIAEMPMQYQTMVSELGLNLSGGQRQRIALARAILGEPRILLLDEATSALDNINEKKVSEEIKRMGTTQIIIAHRLSTIIDADMIVVLENGCIVEKGTHDELIKRQGCYKELYSELV